MIGPLFHWSPAERWAAIRRDGLMPHSPNTVASGKLHYVCAGVNPHEAWQLSGAAAWCSEIELWDLWLIHVSDTDELHVRPFFGRRIEEIKIRNSIPAHRLWWCGRRDIAGVPTCELPTGEHTS